MPAPLKILLIENSEDDAILLADELRTSDFDPIWKRVTAEAKHRVNLAAYWDAISSDFILQRFFGAVSKSVSKM